MKRIDKIAFPLMAFLLVSLGGMAQDIPIRLDFSGISAEENGIMVMGAGFGTYPIEGGIVSHYIYLVEFLGLVYFWVRLREQDFRRSVRSWQQNQAKHWTK